MVLGDQASVAVVVDDLHQAPEASQRLLADVVATGAVTFVATTRSLELPSFDPGEACTPVEVDALDVGAVHELLTDALGEDDPASIDAVAVQLADLTGGNPFFLTSIIRDLADRGALRRRDGFWQLVGEVMVPSDVNRSILDRVEALSGSARSLVEAVCIRANPGPPRRSRSSPASPGRPRRAGCRRVSMQTCSAMRAAWDPTTT